MRVRVHALHITQFWLVLLWDHDDRTRRAFVGADATAFAIIKIDFKAKARAQFNDGIIRANSETVIALEAVAT